MEVTKFVHLVGLIACVSSQIRFTRFDISVVGSLKKYLNCRYYVFVGDAEDVDALEKLKSFLGHDTYYTTVSSIGLEKILASNVSELNFFQKRTTIVTKESLNLTALLTSVSAPHFLTWLVFRDYTLFEKLYIPASCNVLFVTYAEDAVLVSQVYHAKHGVKETVKPLYRWSNGSVVALEPEKINFNNVSMDMLALCPRNCCENVEREKLLTKLECVQHVLLELMGAKLNFRVNEIECVEKVYPYTFPNGSDSELFLKLKYREVDFSGVGHVVRPLNRRDYIDYVWPTFVLKSRMYLKQGKFAGHLTSYIRPLESSVWWGILIWIIISGILVKIFEKLLSNELEFDWCLILDCIFSTFKSLQVFCNQAMCDIPKYLTIRIMYILMLFVVLVFFQAYCGYLVSSLTVSVPHFPFKDLKGFFANQEYRAMTLQRGFHQFYLRKVLGEGQRKNFMLPQDDLPKTIQEAVDKLCTEDHLAFTEFREDLLNFDKLQCKISELPSPMVNVYVGIALPKKTPLKEYLRRELLQLKSAGIVNRLGSRLSSHSDFRDKKSRDEFSRVSLAQVFSIFIFFGAGVLFSVLIFVIELVFKRGTKIVSGLKHNF